LTKSNQKRYKENMSKTSQQMLEQGIERYFVGKVVNPFHKLVRKADKLNADRLAGSLKAHYELMDVLSDMFKMDRSNGYAQAERYMRSLGDLPLPERRDSHKGTCDQCKQVKQVSYGVDPYVAGVYGELLLNTLCSECHYTSAMDV
jgi:hypothetical protein